MEEGILDLLFDLIHLPAIDIRLSRRNLVPTRSFCGSSFNLLPVSNHYIRSVPKWKFTRTLLSIRTVYPHAHACTKKL